MSGKRTDTDVVIRLRRVERSLRRTRLLLAALATLLCVAALGAWRTADEVEAEKLILTGEGGAPVLVLRGVDGYDGPALRIETPAGQEVLTLGPGIRKVR